MRTCKRCNRSDVEFGKDSSKPDGIRIYCNECNREMHKASKNRPEYREKLLAQKKRYREKHKNTESYKLVKKKAFAGIIEKRRKFLIDYFKSHPCVDCGESDPIVLDFDHLIGSGKECSVAGLVARGVSEKRILQEIEKCEVRCCNCHRRKTVERANGWRLYV